MKMKFVGTFFLVGALFGPMETIAKDTTTDTTGEYVDDAMITAKVKVAFAKDKLVKGRDISVRTDHGVVDLTGVVNSKDESNRATDLATKIKAVSAVHNNLKITPN